MIIYFEVTREMLEDQGLKINPNDSNRFLWNLNKNSYLNLSDEAGKIIDLIKRQDYDTLFIENNSFRINEHFICCAELNNFCHQEFVLEKEENVKLIDAILKNLYNNNLQFKEPLTCSIFDIFCIKSCNENFINKFMKE
jgi:hypothetical protein